MPAYIPAEAKAIPCDGGIGSCLVHLMTVRAITSLQSICEQLKKIAGHLVASPDGNMTLLIL